MQEDLAKREVSSGRQLVLGFDARCFTCSDLAGRIEERVGDRLAVRNLYDPEVLAWRKEALGGGAKWAPTLFQVEDGRVQAWVGWKMGWALSRAIGPAATWQVMQALGEVSAAPRIEESTIVEKLPVKAADAVVGMSRGRFLKGVGGAAVAMSVLSGSDLLASQAEAATRVKKPYDVVGGRKITGAELARVAQQLGSTVDVKNLVGNALSTPAKVEAAEPAGFLNELRNGSAQRVVVYRMSSDTTLSYIQYSRPPESENASRALLWEDDAGRKRHIITKASEGGMLWRTDNDARSRISSGTRSLGGCPPIGPKPGGPSNPYWQKKRVCCNIDTSRACIGGGTGTGFACGACYISLAALGVATLIACGGCLSAGIATSGCCEEYRYVWVYVGRGTPA